MKTKIGRYLKSNTTPKRVLFLLLTLFSLGMRVNFLLESDNFYGAIPAQKIYFARCLAGDTAASVLRAQHLYLHMVRIWTNLWGAIMFSPRILSLLFGMFSLIPLYLLVKIVTDERTAFIATFLMGVFPLHVIWSTLSMEEAPFYFLIFSALYFFLKFKFSVPKKRYLLLSALLVTASFGFRLEGILYSFILAPFLLTGKTKKNAVIFLMVSLVFPLLSMVSYWIHNNNPLFPFISQSRYASLELIGRGQNWSRILNDTLKVFPVPFLLLGCIGIDVAAKNKRMSLLHAIFIVFLVFFAAKIKTNSLFFQIRYLMPFGLFFLVYVAVGFVFLLNFLKNAALKTLFIGAFCLWSVFSSQHYLNRNLSEFSFSDELESLTNFVAGLTHEESIIVDVDRYHQYPEAIINSSKVRTHPMMYLSEIEVNGERLDDDFWIKDYKKELLGVINDKKIDYIFYCPEGRSMRFLFPLESADEHIGDVRYKRIIMGKDYWVYKIER